MWRKVKGKREEGGKKERTVQYPAVKSREVLLRPVDHVLCRVLTEPARRRGQLSSFKGGKGKEKNAPDLSLVPDLLEHLDLPLVDLCEASGQPERAVKRQGRERTSSQCSLVPSFDAGSSSS